MKYFQPLLLLIIVVFSQCTSPAPAKTEPDLFKTDPVTIKYHHIRLIRHYSVKYDPSIDNFKRKLLKTSYYDSTGKVFLVVRPGYAVDSHLKGRDVSDSLTGRSDSIFYSYDALGRVVKEVYRGHFNTWDNTSVTVYEYDSHGNQVARTDTREGIDTVTLYTKYVYGKNGRIVYSEDRKVGGDAGEKKFDKVEYAYDDKGNLTRKGEVSYKYNEAGQVVASELVSGIYRLRSDYEYNKAGKCIRSAMLNFDARKNAWDSTGSGDYTYDERNLLISSLDINKEDAGKSLMYIYEYE